MLLSWNWCFDWNLCSHRSHQFVCFYWNNIFLFLFLFYFPLFSLFFVSLTKCVFHFPNSFISTKKRNKKLLWFVSIMSFSPNVSGNLLMIRSEKNMVFLKQFLLFSTEKHIFVYTWQLFNREVDGKYRDYSLIIRGLSRKRSNNKKFHNTKMEC